jgi:putative nucleotidyltransferase with HDIG domain
MSEPSSNARLAEELVRRFASLVRGAQLYQPDHPLIARNVDGLAQAVRGLAEPGSAVTLGLVHGEVVVGDTPMPRASALMGELIDRLQRHGIERIAFEPGVTDEELGRFASEVAALPARIAEGAPSAAAAWVFPHIRTGRITGSREARDGIASDIEAIRRLYNQAVTMSEESWEEAERSGTVDPNAAKEVVEGLAGAVTENRTALVALTAMRTYDNYTFTHMVNVSILTMGQARALGIDGRLLREFGLAALMHDIGKVRTPKEILNKPERLTADELTIMRRHTVDGAEILRRTPEMPILAPVVAFEHHLRTDGSGYPEGAVRPSLNLGTLLCSIADVYDAMRSQRVYQRAFPSDRILAVLSRGDKAEFDPHLVRRFSQLMGIYPPGNLVRLDTGEVAVVIKVHAPDPYRPQVKVLFDPDNRRLEHPAERSLWEPLADGTLQQVVAPVDPAGYAIDPLAFL